VGRRVVALFKYLTSPWLKEPEITHEKSYESWFLDRDLISRHPEYQRRSWV
jgi:hypothetical protein